MRRFEYVGGSSSKFWEIDRNGAKVTVTFGRIGSNGQTQVKDLGTEAAAIAHVDKLVAEKTRKGYIEGSGRLSPRTVTRTAIAVETAIEPKVDAPQVQATSLKPWAERLNILSWRRRRESGAGKALAAEITRIAKSNKKSSTAANEIKDVLADAEVADCREALQLLLREPEVIFPDNYWYRPTTGMFRIPNVQKAIADSGVARAAVEALIRLHRKRPAWAFDQAEVLGTVLVTAIEKVDGSDLPATVDAIRELAGYINTIRDQRIAGLVLPPPPPPRFMLEAVGSLQARDPGLAWQVVRDLSQGPSSLAKVLRRMDSINSNVAAIHTSADAVLKLVELATDLKSSPTRDWLTRWDEIRASAGPGMREALIELALNGEVSPDLTYGGSGTDIPRAAMIALASWDDAETRAFLRKSILHWARSGVGSPVVGTAAVWSLASYGDRAAVVTMLDIRRRIRHKNLLKRLTQEIERLSEKLGVTPDEIADESVDDCGLQSDGSRRWTIGDYQVALRLQSNGNIVRDVMLAGSKSVKDVPAAVRKEHADTWAEVTAVTKLLRETVSIQRQRLETAMVDGKRWRRNRWDHVFRSHPVLWNLAQRLVWRTDEGLLAMPTAEGWVGEAVSDLPADASLTVAHPALMTPAEQAYWQHRIVAENIVQPFKQVYRETYFVTPAEVEEIDRSHRFSGHLIPNQMMYALAKGRGWTGTMGLSGFDGAGQGIREFPTWGVTAAIEQEWAGNDDFSTIAEVSFTCRDANGLPRRTRIDEVPKIPFSEAMRDIDLVVAVASIGTDQQWLDWDARREAGTERWSDLRDAYASVAAAASAVRGRMIEELVPRMGLADRVVVEGHFVHVKGKLGQYRIHLGSANIHMEPSGRYLCIVPARSKTHEPVYLPFEDPDVKSAEVVSKILLLARDDQITDPVITAQLRRSN